MSKVVFDIEFTVNGLVELIGKASISRRQAQRVPGMVDNIDTVIRFDELQANITTKVKPKKKGKEPKQEVEIKPEKSVKLSEQNEDEDQMDIENAENNMGDPEQMDENQDLLQEDAEMEIMDSEDDDQEEVSSNEQEIMMNYENKKMTKRQLGQLQSPMELPLKRSRKKKDDSKLTQEQILRKLEREQKRRQQMKRHLESQKMETLDKILNETGKKQRQRHQKESKDQMNRHNKNYRSLGDVPKIVFHSDKNSQYLLVHDTKLFPDQMLAQPKQTIRPNCYRCDGKGKYRVDQNRTVCSLPCYKSHNQQQSTKMRIEV